MQIQTVLKRHLIISAIQLASLMASLASQVLLARLIGPGSELDLYFAALGFATAFVGSVGVAATYLVPALILQQKSLLFDSRLTAGSCLVALGLAALTLAAIGAAIFVLGTGMTASFQSLPDRSLIITLCWISASAAVVVAVFSAIGSAYQWIEWPMGFTMLAPVAVVGALLWPGKVSVATVAAAQCAGILVQTMALALLLRQHWVVRTVTVGATRSVLRVVPLAAFSGLCFSGYAIVDALLAPWLDEGVMSRQALAQRLVIAFGAVVSAGPFMLAPTRLVSLEGANERLNAWRYLLATSMAMCGVAWLTAALTTVFGRSFVGLLFQGGAFSAVDSDEVAHFLAYLLIGAGPMLATAVVFRLLHGLGRQREVASISCAWLALYGSLAWALKEMLGSSVLSIAYATSWLVIGAVVLARSRWLLLAHAGLPPPLNPTNFERKP
jgi:putative peptidoglycan lipid II flippase